MQLWLCVERGIFNVKTVPAWPALHISNSSDWVPERFTFLRSEMEYKWIDKNGWNQARPVKNCEEWKRCDSVRSLLNQKDIKVLGNLFCIEQGGWTRWPSEVLSNLIQSVIQWFCETTSVLSNLEKWSYQVRMTETALNYVSNISHRSGQLVTGKLSKLHWSMNIT